MFINRHNELELLETRFASEKAEFFVLYGRRRVGKTELLSHFCQGKRSIFFIADLGSEISLRTSLSNAVNAILFGAGQMDAVYSSWEALFSALAQAAHTERLVMVLDEFPYLVTAYPALPSLLQKAWDQSLKNSKIMLILCGSFIGMMEEFVLGYQAPLYGRRTAQYLLEPLRFIDACLFYPNFHNEDLVRTFAIYGGTPAYLQTIDQNLSLQDNVLKRILTRGAYLYDEVRFVLQQELREPRNYFAILQAVAAGNSRLNDIKQATGLTGATAYLDTLQELHLIERLVPITESQPHKSRRGIYRLKDHYFRFWFRYLHPNRSQLEQGGAKTILENKIIPEIDHFSSLAFEEVCQNYLWDEGLAANLPFRPVKIGRWWNAKEEIDLVVIGDTDAMLCECKWSNRPVGSNILSELEKKVDSIQHDLGDRKIQYAICSRSGFTPQLVEQVSHRKDTMLITLNQILRTM